MILWLLLGILYACNYQDILQAVNRPQYDVAFSDLCLTKWLHNKYNKSSTEYVTCTKEQLTDKLLDVAWQEMYLSRKSNSLKKFTFWLVYVCCSSSGLRWLGNFSLPQIEFATCEFSSHFHPLQYFVKNINILANLNATQDNSPTNQLAVSQVADWSTRRQRI